MTRSRKLILSLITYIPVTLLIIAGAIYVVHQISRVTGYANVIIADELSRRFNKEVRIGSASVDKLGTAVLEDIRVANGRTFAHGTLVSVRKVVIHYDWRAMLFGGKAAASVSRVDVTAPSVLLVRRVNGSFNITELLKRPPGPAKPPFKGKVAISDGRARFLDYAVTRGARPKPIYLRSVSGILQAASQPLYRFGGTARGVVGQFVMASFSGTYQSRRKQALIHVDARSIDATRLMPYVLKSKAVKVNSGILNGSADIELHHHDRRYALTVSGKGSVRNATVVTEVLKVPVTGVNGKLVLTPDKLDANLNGFFAGSPVSAVGTLSDFKHLLVGATVTSSSLDMRSAIAAARFLGPLAQFGPSGRGQAKVVIKGRLSSLTADAVATVPNATVRGVRVQNVAVSAAYRPGRVDLKSVRLTAKGADIRTSGYVLTKPAVVLSLRGSFTNLQLSSLPVKSQVGVTGRASGTFVAVGPATNPGVSVTARVVDGSIADVPFTSVVGSLGISGTRLTVKDLAIKGVLEGSIRASGVVSGKAFDLRAAAESIDIGSLASRLGEKSYGGTAFLDAHVYGSLKSPHVDGSGEVFEAKANGYMVNHARVAFTADRNRITVSEGVIQSFPAELRFSGEATGLSSARVSFAGKTSMSRLEITKIMEISQRDLDITGTASGELNFSGAYLPDAPRGAQRFVDMAASGSISLEDVTAFGYPVSETTAKINYANNILALSDAVVTSDSAKLALNGTLNTSTHEVDAGFDLTDFDLSRLHEFIGDYVVLAGVASAAGRMQGTWENAKATVSAGVEGLSVNYEKFDRAKFQLSYDNGKFTNYSVDIARAGQSMVITGNDFDPDTQCMASTNGVLTDVSVPDVLSILRASPFFSSPKGKRIANAIDSAPKISTGRVNGTFSLSGCLQSPDGEFQVPDAEVDLTATKVAIDVQQIDAIKLRASAKNGVVSLGEFSAASGDTRVAVTGDKAYADGNTHLEISADNLRLSQLSPWLGPNAVEGNLSALFSVDGPVSSPDILGSIDVVKPGYGGFTIDSLRASQIRVSANRIDIPTVLFAVDGHQATASASVPWNWSTLSVPDDEPLSISASLPRQNLSILSALWSKVDVGRTTGTLGASFELTGSLLDPRMTGSGTIADGTIAITGFTNTFTNVTADLQFTGDRLVINKMSASSSQGGNVHVVPGGYVTVGISIISEANMALVADRLIVAEKNMFGFRESISTQIDAGLAITGSPTEPTIADAAVEGKQGGIALSNAKISFQTAPGAGQWPALLAFNPNFNVSLRVGQDVAISPPSLELAVTGAGKLTGSLAKPVVQGMELKVVSGEISLATARLSITPGGTIRINYAPPASPDVSLDFQAKASVSAINSVQQRERYQITMRITGQATKPNIDLSSSPPGLSREQMLAALGHLPGLFTSAEAGLQNELANALTAVGASTLFAPIENIFIQRLGFEQFSLEYSPIFPLSLYVSRHMFGNWYISFYRQMTSTLIAPHDTLYQVVLSYRWKGIYEFSAGADDQQTLIFQVGYTKAFR